MDWKEEHYMDYVLCHNGGSANGLKLEYWVHVRSVSEKEEFEEVFIEYTDISYSSIAGKFGTFDSGTKEKAMSFIERISLSKAKSRILLEQYDIGKQYKQEIGFEESISRTEEISDESIKLGILRSLLTVRKKSPENYEYAHIDIEGFCLLFGISRDRYVFNASLLLEDGFIAEGKTQYDHKNGGGYITSKGVNFLASRTENASPSLSTSVNSKRVFEYDVAISFAGENREIARGLAQALKAKGISVFYDDYETAGLWGKNLYEHLSDVYGKKARYCVMLVSIDYARKAWTNHERKSAQARALNENGEYILPVRIDRTEIPGLHHTIACVYLSDHSIEEIAGLVQKKLTLSANSQ